MAIRIVPVPGFAAVTRCLATRCLVCALVSSLSWQFAAAAEQGFYVGASYGQVKNDAKQTGFDDLALFVYDFYGFAPGQGSTTFDSKDSGFGFFGGYRMFANLAFEGGYLDLGEVAYRDTTGGNDLVTGDPGTWSQTIGANTSGMTLSALGILPLSYRSELYARVGVMFSTNELNIYITDGTDSAKPNASDDSTDLLAGIGAGFTFAEIYTARLEYQRIFDVGADAVGKADIDMISLGVTVTF